MHIRRWVSVLFVPLLVLAACGDDDESPTVGGEDGATTTTQAAEASDNPFGAPADHTLTIEDSETQLTVAVGETIDVVLETCPSCGYHWEEMAGNYTGALEVVGAEDGPSNNEEGEVGGSVLHYVRFRAVSAGDDIIAQGYIPPGTPEAEEIFSLEVTVTES